VDDFTDWTDEPLKVSDVARGVVQQISLAAEADANVATSFKHQGHGAVVANHAGGHQLGLNGLLGARRRKRPPSDHSDHLVHQLRLGWDKNLIRDFRQS